MVDLLVEIDIHKYIHMYFKHHIAVYSFGNFRTDRLTNNNPLHLFSVSMSKHFSYLTDEKKEVELIFLHFV